jgi:hypothetical protein
VVSDSLYNYLSAQVSSVTNRVYPLVIPQQVYDEATKQPCLVYTMDTDTRQVTQDGTNALVRGSLQVDCYARSYKAAQTLAAAVRTALVDYSGLMAAATSPITSTEVNRIHLEGESNLMDEEPGLYRVMQRYAVWYYE